MIAFPFPHVIRVTPSVSILSTRIASAPHSHASGFAFLMAADAVLSAKACVPVLESIKQTASHGTFISSFDEYTSSLQSSSRGLADCSCVVPMLEQPDSKRKTPITYRTDETFLHIRRREFEMRLGHRPHVRPSYKRLRICALLATGSLFIHDRHLRQSPRPEQAFCSRRIDFVILVQKNKEESRLRAEAMNPGLAVNAEFKPCHLRA